jgi:hypothetical protein
MRLFFVIYVAQGPQDEQAVQARLPAAETKIRGNRELVAHNPKRIALARSPRT